MEFDRTKLEQIKTIILEHKGKKNAIPSPEIAEIIGIDAGASNVTIRSYITETMRVFNIPIGSAGRKGYYLIETEEELRSNLYTLNSRIHNINERTLLIQKAYGKFYDGVELEQTGETILPENQEDDEED